MSKKVDKFGIIFREKIGQVFREMRETSGKTQEDIGRNADINRITIGKWENAKKLPDIYELYKAIREICPNQVSFWEKVEKEFDPVFKVMNKAADKAKIDKYLKEVKKKR